MSHYVCNMKREWGREPASSNTEVLACLEFALHTFISMLHI